MKTFILEGKEITFDDDFCKANEIFREFHIKSWKCYDDFLNELYNYSNLDDMMSNLHDLSTKQILNCIHDAVKKIVNLGVMTYSQQNFIDEYYDNFFSIIQKPYEFYVEQYNEILDNEEKKKMYRQYQRESRSKWVGGGFGLSGAIEGAINAGILNTVTGAFRFVGDTVVNIADGCGVMMDKSNLKNSDIFEKYAQYVRVACENVGFSLYDKLVDLGALKAIQLDIDEVDSIISNMQSYSSSKPQQVNYLINCISKNPYNYDIYKLLFRKLGFNNIEVAEIASYFGFVYEVENNFYVHIVDKLNQIMDLPQNSPVECEKKYNAVKNYLISIRLMNSDGLWDDKYIKTFRFEDEKKSLCSSLTTLQEMSLHVQGTSFSSVTAAQNRYEQLKAEEAHRLEVKLAQDKAKETAGSVVGCLVILAIVGGIIWGCIKIAPIVFNVIFEPSSETTTTSQYSSSNTNSASSSANTNSASSSANVQETPKNPTEAEYFENTCVVNYHRWFGGEVIKKDTGKFIDSNQGYTRYIYSYDNTQYPQQYGELLIKDGCRRVESKTVTEDGEKLTKEVYSKQNPTDTFGIVPYYTIHVHIYHDRNAILIIVPDKSSI